MGNERSCLRHISVITFPFVLVSVVFPVTFFEKTHVQDRTMNVSEILSLHLRTIKVNKGKFTLEIGPLNGCHAFDTRARCIDATTVKCARLRLFSILSDISLI